MGFVHSFSGPSASIHFDSGSSFTKMIDIVFHAFEACVKDAETRNVYVELARKSLVYFNGGLGIKEVLCKCFKKEAICSSVDSKELFWEQALYYVSCLRAAAELMHDAHKINKFLLLPGMKVVVPVLQGFNRTLMVRESLSSLYTAVLVNKAIISVRHFLRNRPDLNEQLSTSKKIEGIATAISSGAFLGSVAASSCHLETIGNILMGLSAFSAATAFGSTKWKGTIGLRK
jgi:hypothetical protein